MNARTRTLAMPATFKPPLWLAAATAAALAAALLYVFVGTLQENMRRGDQLRQLQASAQRVSIADAGSAWAGRASRQR
jgi:hypothetical protein